MPEAYIVDAVRTPVGKRKGALGAVHSADLGAHVIQALVEKNKLDPASVDDVVFGCIDTIGPQAGDIARTCWLAAGYPESVPGVTVDRQCGSSQQALHFAAQAVMSGTQDIVIAGGVQNMTMIPIGAAFLVGEQFGCPNPFATSKGFSARYGDSFISQFRSAEMIAHKWELSREAMERYALESHRRALAAIAQGHFKREIVPLAGVEHDQCPRETTLEQMAQLQPLAPGGSITAALSSQNSDGAAALLVVSDAALKRYGFRPRARVHHLTVRGDDPVWMLTAPIPAVRHALKKTGMKLSDIDLIEINEAFVPVVMAWQKELDADPACINVNGGAVALGHPIGATGARLMTTLLHELERSGKRWGLQTMCEGGGQANVTIIERL
jgi:acetyl-CoA C-acetyltransferase